MPRDIIELRAQHRLSRAELEGTQKIPNWLAKFLDCLQRNGWEQT